MVEKLFRLGITISISPYLTVVRFLLFDEISILMGYGVIKIPKSLLRAGYTNLVYWKLYAITLKEE